MKKQLVKKFFSVTEILWKNAKELGCAELLIIQSPNEFLTWAQEVKDIEAFELGLRHYIKNKIELSRINLKSEDKSEFDEKAHELIFELYDNPQIKFETLQERLPNPTKFFDYSDFGLMAKLKTNRTELRKIGLTTHELYDFLSLVAPLKRLILYCNSNQINRLANSFYGELDALLIMTQNYFTNVKNTSHSKLILESLISFKKPETTPLRTKVELMSVIVDKILSRSCDQTTSCQEQVGQVQRA